MGAGQYGAASAVTHQVGTRSSTERRQHRQPMGQNHRKRGERGIDGNKKVNGRKRHIVVDTLGLLLLVIVHPANIADITAAKTVFSRLKPLMQRMVVIWADR